MIINFSITGFQKNGDVSLASDKGRFLMLESAFFG